MVHVIKYTESERGWGGEVWYREFSTEQEAKGEVFNTNKDLPKAVPDWYIAAEYIGEMEKSPEGYKF
ncbi:Phage protein [Yersinia phage fHe-Yen9-04]|uniref:Phage protein n=2 Tax=Eneladusvirus Yen904 TaxID=2560849 RepID=A0A2C9CY35_9CAUD|nr:Phage protein [Yersinia phage fHe-Yen9-04]SOK58751.1 Phage protein [Yersinia phage fHe-Yen9-04]SOK59286.1 Phage protein [Yersinia phage fHe-Yen9-03]VUE36520.1 Phage protein [Yersinia phage fHe-Yen9-04]